MSASNSILSGHLQSKFQWSLSSHFIKQISPVIPLIVPLLIKICMHAHIYVCVCVCIYIYIYSVYVYMYTYIYIYSVSEHPERFFSEVYLDFLIQRSCYMLAFGFGHHVREHLRMISCSFSWHVPAICRQSVKGHSFNELFYFIRADLYYASMFPADIKRSSSLCQ